jgi:hypothetical protein
MTTTIDELLEAVFSVVSAEAVATQRRGKHVYAAMKSTLNNRGNFGCGVFYATSAEGLHNEDTRRTSCQLKVSL